MNKIFCQNLFLLENETYTIWITLPSKINTLPPSAEAEKHVKVSLHIIYKTFLMDASQSL